MALLIDIGMPEWLRDEDLRTEVLSQLPDADVRCMADPGNLADIEVAAVTRLRPDLPGRLPNLKLIQKLGAGVDTMVSHPSLPEHVRIARLKPEEPAREIAEFCLAYVLRDQRHLLFHAARQADRVWEARAPRDSHKTVVGVLGLGHIGLRTARLFADLGFQVIGWSRSPKYYDDIDCRHGADALPMLLGQCDYVASVLPSTAATRGLFDRSMFAAMKPGSMLINVGRGDLVVEEDLLASLDGGRPGSAVLDVVRTEPLPEDSPLWRHPGVTITPHVSGWHLGDALKDVAENYRRLTAGEPLLHEVDRVRGY